MDTFSVRIHCCHELWRWWYSTLHTQNRTEPEPELSRKFAWFGSAWLIKWKHEQPILASMAGPGSIHGEFYRTVTRNVVLWCSACGVQQSENFHTKGSRLTAGRPAECSPLEVISGIQLCRPLRGEGGRSAVEHGCSSINFVTCRYGKVLSAHVARG